MKPRKSIDLTKLWDAIKERGDTTSSDLAESFGFSPSNILSSVHKLEEMHPGQVMVHYLGISSCVGKSKEDIDRWLLCAGRNQSFINRAKHIAEYSLKPAQKRIGNVLLKKAVPERRLLTLESGIDFFAEWRRDQDKDIVGSFDFDENGKMTQQQASS